MDKVQAAVLALMNEHQEQKQRIAELERKLRDHRDSILDFHCEDSVYLDHSLGFIDKLKHSREYILKHTAGRIGRRMLEEGYISYTEELIRDGNHTGTWFRIRASVEVVKPNVRGAR